MGLVGLKVKDDIPYGSSASGSSMGLVGLKIKRRYCPWFFC